jgi:hypothetical protein
MNKRRNTALSILIGSTPGPAVRRAGVAGGKRNPGPGAEDLPQ